MKPSQAIENDQGTAHPTNFADFAEFPSPYLKAMLMRLRIEMFSAAKALRGELLEEFWRSIDTLNTLRPRQPEGTATVIMPDVLRGLIAMSCALTVPQAEDQQVRAACEWLRSCVDTLNILRRRPPEGFAAVIPSDVLRGLIAMGGARTVPQAEHRDVRTACEWLRSFC